MNANTYPTLYIDISLDIPPAICGNDARIDTRFDVVTLLSGRSLMSPSEYLMRSLDDSSGRSFSLDDVYLTNDNISIKREDR